MKLTSHILAVLLLFVVAGAPAHAATSSHITSFTASTLKAAWRQDVTLTWKGTGNGGCQLRYDYKVGKEGSGSRYITSETDMNGSYTVNPQADTTYEIYCTNQGSAAPGEALYADSKKLTIKVANAEKAPLVTVQKVSLKKSAGVVKVKYTNVPKGSILAVRQQGGDDVLREYTVRKNGKGSMKLSIPVTNVKNKSVGFEYVIEAHVGTEVFAVSEPFLLPGDLLEVR